MTPRRRKTRDFNPEYIATREQWKEDNFDDPRDGQDEIEAVMVDLGKTTLGISFD